MFDQHSKCVATQIWQKDIEQLVYWESQKNFKNMQQ